VTADPLAVSLDPVLAALLAIGAVLALIVAAIFARSVMQHELELWHRHRDASLRPRR
jgi:hypothetical protein